MASICGNIVMNNAGSERHFDSPEDLMILDDDLAIVNEIARIHG